MPDDVRIRMYNVGFGDCFLIEFPRTAPEPFRVLVDCGAHTAGYPRDGWKPAVTVDQIIEDVSDKEGVARIDIVVATHRHQDHVSGFTAERWREVQVREVWMPWTEDPTDPDAAVIRSRQSRLALGLDLAFKQREFEARWTNVHVKESLRSIAQNSLTNESAMRTLHRGFAGRPERRFLSVAETDTLVVDGCPDLVAHVLGPSRDESVIRDMDPPTGQSYLRFQAAPETDDPLRPSSASEHRQRGPFPRNLSMACTDYEADPSLGEPLDDKIKDAAAAMMRDDDLATAVSLDKAVNGTSLMLMFEFRNAFLFFPGDAQWGTWNRALRDPRARDLLSKTTFYKVGHHGSHNATPVEFVESVVGQEKKIWGAATSVHPVSFWPEIPRAPLLTALAGRSDRMVRSDRPGRSKDGYAVRKGSVGVDFHVPA